MSDPLCCSCKRATRLRCPHPIEWADIRGTVHLMKNGLCCDCAARLADGHCRHLERPYRVVAAFVASITYSVDGTALPTSTITGPFGHTYTVVNVPPQALANGDSFTLQTRETYRLVESSDE